MSDVRSYLNHRAKCAFYDGALDADLYLGNIGSSWESKATFLAHTCGYAARKFLNPFYAVSQQSLELASVGAPPEPKL